MRPFRRRGDVLVARLVDAEASIVGLLLDQLEQLLSADSADSGGDPVLARLVPAGHADPEIATAITSNMSERNREALAEEAGELGRVKKSQVEEARNLLVRAMRELAGTAGLELKTTAPEPGAADVTELPAEPAAEEEDEYVD